MSLDKRIVTLEVETELGHWKTKEMSPEERRTLIKSIPPQRRFITAEGVIQIPHPLNLWCLLSDQSWDEDES